MISNPKISVIIPAFDVEATITTTIDSILAQSVRCDEIIVVDDGSARELAPILSKYGSVVKCIRQKNAGAAAARNTAIEAATGELIAFLDADDTWEPRKLERQLQILRDYPQVGLVASRYFTRSPGEAHRLLQPCDDGLLNHPIEARDEELFRLGSLIWTGTVLLRRSALGDERFVPGLKVAEDRDMWIRIIRKHAAYVMSEPLATALLVPGSLSRRDPDSGYEPMLHVWRRHADLVSRRALRRAEARVYRAWAAAYLSEQRPRRALPLAVQRWRRDPLSLQAWWIVAKCIALSPIQRDSEAMIAHDGRDRESLRRHFDIERSLANRLRAANADDRRGLYGQVYNELFERVPDHPQNTRKHSAEAQHAASVWQMRLLTNFVRSDSRYLELGAGDCHLAMDVAKLSKWSYGVDVSNIISSSAAQPTNFSLIISDGVKIDVPRGSIDVAYSNQLMEHLHPDDAAAQLSQIRRALAPGGSYVCVTPHRHSGPHDISKFFAAEPCGFHLKEYTYAELRSLFLSAGFDSAQVWTGVKGHYFAAPSWLILFIERALAALPRPLRAAIARAPLFRAIFINVLLVGRVSAARATVIDDRDPSEITAHA